MLLGINIIHIYQSSSFPNKVSHKFELCTSFCDGVLTAVKSKFMSLFLSVIGKPLGVETTETSAP